MPLESVSVQTQLTRCLGPLSQWPRSLAEPIAARFSMLHFTPVQRLGGSGSAYSIWDQLSLQSSMFEGMESIDSAVESAAQEHLTKIRDLPPSHPIRKAWNIYADSSQGQQQGQSARVQLEAVLSEARASLERVLRSTAGSLQLERSTPSPCSPLTLPTVVDPPFVCFVPGERLTAADPQERWDPHMEAYVEGAKMRVLADTVARLEREAGVMSMVDIVLNHTSADSPWLARHPDAAFSLQNSPHLRPAWELDAAIRQFSAHVAADDFASEDVHPRMDSPAMVHRTFSLLESWIPRHVRLWEFYVMNVDAEEAALGSWLLSLASRAESGPSSAEEEEWAALRSRAPPVVLDPLWTPSSLQQGAEFIQWLRRIARTASSNFRAAGEALPDESVHRLVQSLIDSGAVWNDGSGGRWAAHVSPDETMQGYQQTFQAGESSGSAAGLPWEEESCLESAATWARVMNPPQDTTCPDPPVCDPECLELPLLLGAAEVWQSQGGDAPIIPDKPSKWAASGIASALSRYRRILLAVNFVLYRHYDDDWEAARDAIKGTAMHFWCNEQGGKGTVGKDGPFVPRYFLQSLPPPAPADDGSKGEGEGWDTLNELATHGTPIDSLVLACNGFIWGGDPEVDFTLPRACAAEYAKIVKQGPEMEFVVSEPDSWGQGIDEAVGIAGAPLRRRLRDIRSGHDDVLRVSSDAEEPWQPMQLPRITTPPSRLHELASAAEEEEEEAASAPRQGDRAPSRYVDGWVPIDAAARMSPLARSPETRRVETVADEAVSVTPWASGSESVSTPSSGHGATNRRGLLRHCRWRRLTLAGQSLQLPPSIAIPVVAASTPYMRREVVIWGDCVKLRYGLSPRDSPWLWAHMQEYVKRMARVFHAVRLDNAHGTPIHVAAAMLDAAREERPHLYVNAELFTGDVGRDVEYVARLGINSLVREAMQAPSESELSHYVLRHGGTPIGSMRTSDPYIGELLPAPIPAILFDCTHDNPVPAQKRTASDALSNAALTAAAVGGIGSVRGYDRCVPRTLSVVSEFRWYVAPSSSSDVGADSFRWPLQMAEFPDEHDGQDSGESLDAIPAVQPPWEDGVPSEDVEASLREGLLPVRRRLNELHQNWAKKGFSEVHVHHVAPPRGRGGDVVAVHRGHPSSPFSFVVIARTAFHGSEGMDREFAPSLRLIGQVVGVELSASLEVPAFSDTGSPPQGEEEARLLRDKYRHQTLETTECSGKAGEWTPSPVVVNGVPLRLQWYAPRSSGALETTNPLREDPLGLASWWEGDVEHAINSNERVPTVGPGRGALPETLLRLDGKRFQPGSVLVLRLVAPRRPSIPTDRITFLPPAIPEPERRLPRSSGTRHAEVVWGPPLSSLEAVLMDTELLSLPALARLLYRADPEERDDSGGSRGVFVVPGHGALPWCGVAGVEHTLRPVRQWNNLGHAVCENIRQGHWLANYLVERIRDEPALEPIATWMERHFELVHQMPPGLQPYAVDRIVSAVFHCSVSSILYRMQRSPLLQRLMGHIWDHVAPAEEDRSRPPRDRRSGHASRHPIPPRRLLHWVVDVQSAIAYMQRSANPEQTTSSPVAAHMPQRALPVRKEPSPGIRQERKKRLSRQEKANEKKKKEEDSNADDGEGEVWHPDVAFRTFLTPAAPLPFVVALSLTSVQLFSNVRSAPLLDVALLPDRPCFERNGGAVERWVGAEASLAAGVDHFCTGFMRNWGRDTFICLRGLMLLTGRFAEARTVLLAYATVVRHGLIPNLMDGGRRPRYNARDATWWFLQALQDYCTLSPEEDGILEEHVIPRFPSDAKEEYHEEGDEEVPCFVYRHGSIPPKTLGSIVCDILRRHAQGISFVEWNAGPAIDANMKEPGFHVEVSLDRRTGFLHGGNVHNCGTWMDKMGESDKFGTRGVPATPRDGAPVELTGLLYSTLRWAAAEAGCGKLPTDGVWLPHEEASDREWWSWHEWAHAIQAAFEAEHWVPESASKDTAAIDTSLVNVRGIYKDTVGGGLPWADYQLRPNQLVAMTVAPDLFVPQHAKRALNAVERQLIGCESHQMGIRTLDPSDWAFRGNYDNNDETERGSARGWNYHNGPAWLWPFGYYLRARLRFCPTEDGSQGWRPGAARRWVLTRTVPHRRHMVTQPTGGLPELTQADGSPCADSCAVQAWSSATLLDALFDAELVEERDFESLGLDV